MCLGCWDGYGRSSDLPADADEVVDLIDELYSRKDGFSGGPMHVVVDDWNLEDEHLAFCMNQVEEQFASGACSIETCQLARRLGDRLRSLPLAQRVAVLAKQEGFI